MQRKHEPSQLAWGQAAPAGISEKEDHRMRTTIAIPSDVMDELMEIAGTDDRTKAVEVAIREHVKHLKIQRLIALRGTVDIAENDEIESWDDVGIRDA
jgi:Arc/MetJ family transcription regulator